tara:strand:- start:1074 stop:1316 length:243 start_codon:yes stop_codon:yes gene_type:complete
MPGQDIIKYFLMLAGGAILYISLDLIVERVSPQIVCGGSASCSQMLVYVGQYKPLVPFVILIFATLWLWVKGLNAQEQNY